MWCEVITRNLEKRREEMDKWERERGREIFFLLYFFLFICPVFPNREGKKRSEVKVDKERK